MKKLAIAIGLGVSLAFLVSCVNIPTDYTGRLKLECFSPDSGKFIIIQTGDTLPCYTSKTP